MGRLSPIIVRRINTASIESSLSKFMKLGHINIPKPDVDSSSIMLDLSTQLILLYSKIVEEQEFGQRCLKELESDERVQKLEGKMISNGSGASRFSVKELAMWYLWAANEYGIKDAKKNLDKFLDSDEIRILNTLLVLGVEVEESIELSDGISIIPISELPDSRTKQYCEKIDFSSVGQTIPKPKAAITSFVSIRRIREEQDASKTSEIDKKFWENQKKLYDTSLVLNSLQTVSCIPHFATSLPSHHHPFGPFSGSGGSYRPYDIIGQGTTKIGSSQKATIEEVLSKLSTMQGKRKAKYSRILTRLSQSKRRQEVEDKILDLCIALEMALLDDNHNNQQLSLSFRLRGSWLIAENNEDRLSVYRDLRDLYKYRSQVAHSGNLSGKDVGNAYDSLSRYTLIAEKIIRRLICGEKPDWSTLVLGFNEYST